MDAAGPSRSGSSSGNSNSSGSGMLTDNHVPTSEQQPLLRNSRGYEPPPLPPQYAAPTSSTPAEAAGASRYAHRASSECTGSSSPRSSIVLVRADGTGVCADGSVHSWKQVYPPRLWCIACMCFACCGPLYCSRHPQRHCTKCGIVIRHPVNN